MFAILVLALTGALVFSHMSPFPALLEAFRPAKSLWKMPQASGGREIYLTFDDGPNVRWTPRVLDALKEHGARATFFLIDDHLSPETEWVVRRIVDEGHAIGLHSGTRRLMVLDPEDLAARIAAAADRIAAITGARPCRLFRPHAGWRSATMYEALARLEYRLAGWSWGMWDWDWWQTPRAASLARKLGRKAASGDIIVIHDGHHRDSGKDRSHAAVTVRLLVPALHARGFTFKPMCGT